MPRFVRNLNFTNFLSAAWQEQFPKIWLILIISLTFAFCGILATYILSILADLPLSWLTRDPASVTGSSVFVGLLSNLGIMGWTAAATICLGTAVLLKFNNLARQSALFMAASGVLCLILAFDDELMLHERLLPHHFHISEKLIFLGYLLIVVSYAGYFFRQLLRTEYLLLILTFFFLGLSIAMDQILPNSGLETFAEDSPKFVGIVLWVAYFARTAFVIIRDSAIFNPDDARNERADSV